MRNPSLEAQIWMCQHANVAVEAPPSNLVFIYFFKIEFMFLAWWLKSLYHDKMFPDALCPQHHLTVHSDQLVSSGKGLATCPRGRSWLMSEGKRDPSKVKSCCAHVFTEARHQAVAVAGAKREEDDCPFTRTLGGQWLTVSWSVFPNCWPFNVEDSFFRHSKAKSSEREQVHFLHSDLCLRFEELTFAFVGQRSDSAALKPLQPWELERMMSEAVDDKVRADRAKLIKAGVHWEPHNRRNDMVAGLGVLTSWGGEVMVLMPALDSVHALRSASVSSSFPLQLKFLCIGCECARLDTAAPGHGQWSTTFTALQEDKCPFSYH